MLGWLWNRFRIRVEDAVGLLQPEALEKCPSRIPGDALALGVSVDYLLGLTNDPSPKAADLSRVMVDLLDVAQTLPECKQRDLLLIAQAYQRSMQEGAPDADRLMADLLEQVEAEGGKEALDVLLRVLERLLPGQRFGPPRSSEEGD